MIANYILSEDTNHMELQLLPSKREQDIKELKFTRGDSLVQAKLVGDIYPGFNAWGMTMRNCGTVEACNFKNRKQKK